VGGVLDRQNVVLTRDRKQVVEIARLAGEIHREDRSGTAGDSRRHVGRIQHQRVRPDIGEDRHAPLIENGVGRRDERQRRRDLFMAGPGSCGKDGAVERRGP